MYKLIDFREYHPKTILLDELPYKFSIKHVILLILITIVMYVLLYFSDLIFTIFMSLFLFGSIFYLLYEEKKVKKRVPDYKVPNFFLFINWEDPILVQAYHQELIKSPLIEMSKRDLEYNEILNEQTKPPNPIFNKDYMMLIIGFMGIVVAAYSPVFQRIENLWEVITLMLYVSLVILALVHWLSYLNYSSAKTKYGSYKQRKAVIDFLLFYHKNKNKITNKSGKDEE
ncbi:hypothetical protein GNY06_08920 [Elizabethkingia argentiflava]|uniref:Uncharacterized protein n=1 Tax=Elizabethkingia argenteiflava TaxID=2681556 RepID=A0A845PWD7_9FLAO|nr:hypothetical protein [Elizabethkingia argenteiflava]NAW51493.1 hypothetical protein [Elizabethkingia argenteiflava]